MDTEKQNNYETMTKNDLINFCHSLGIKDHKYDKNVLIAKLKEKNIKYHDFYKQKLKQFSSNILQHMCDDAEIDTSGTDDEIITRILKKRFVPDLCRYFELELIEWFSELVYKDASGEKLYLKYSNDVDKTLVNKLNDAHLNDVNKILK